MHPSKHNKVRHRPHQRVCSRPPPGQKAPPPVFHAPFPSPTLPQPQAPIFPAVRPNTDLEHGPVYLLALGPLNARRSPFDFFGSLAPVRAFRSAWPKPARRPNVPRPAGLPEIWPAALNFVLFYPSQTKTFLRTPCGPRFSQHLLTPPRPWMCGHEITL